MKVVKKVSVGGEFAKKGTDIFDGDLITITNEGDMVEGEYGTQLVLKAKTRNGEKNISLNQTSQNNLIDAFGDETNTWVGKEIKVFIIKAMVSGKLREVLYLAHPEWEMDSEGKFAPKDGIRPEDIPF